MRLQEAVKSKAQSEALRRRAAEAYEDAEGPLEEVAARFCIGAATLTRWNKVWRGPGGFATAHDRCGRVPTTAAEGNVALLKRKPEERSVRTCDELAQAGAVLRERRVVEQPHGQVHVEKPARHQVVSQLPAERSLTPHREQRHRERAREQPLRRPRGADHQRLQGVQLASERARASIDGRVEPADGMVLGHKLLT